MFRDAYEITKEYTHPLVVALRFFDKTIEGGLGSYIVLNNDGWLMTVAHNFEASFAYNQHQKEIKEYQAKIQDINTNKQLKKSQRKALLRTNKPNNKWVTDFAILLSGRSIKIEEFYIYGKHDLALFRIDRSAIMGQKVFPKIIDPKKIKSGTSLCKLGFPFVEFKPTFNEVKNQFELPPNLLPLPVSNRPGTGEKIRWVYFLF